MKPVRCDSWRAPLGNAAACASRRVLPRCGVTVFMWLALASITGAQFDFEGGTIKTKDLGYGVLDVHYFNEQSASGTGGCIHVEVVSPSGPSASERNLEFVFYANFLRTGPKEGTAIRFPVRLPEGARSTVVTVPYVAPGESTQSGNQVWVMLWDLEVSEDGRDIEASRIYTGSRSRAAPSALPPGTRDAYHVLTTNSGSWSLLRIVEDRVAPASLQPEMFRLLSATQRDSNTALTNSLTAKTNYGISSDWQNVGNVRTLSTAPDDWQYYLQFNIVVLDDALLKLMQQQRPSLAESLKQYVIAGGSLLLVGQGPAVGQTQPGEDQLTGKALIDQWLGGADASTPDGVLSDKSTTDHSGGWHKMTPPMNAWWSRKSNMAQPGQMQAGMAPATQATLIIDGSAGARTTFTPSSPPSAPRPPSSAQSAGMAGSQPNTPIDPSTAAQEPEAAAATGPLSAGGVARDLLTGLETYSMAEFGTPAIVVDKLIEVITGEGGPMVMSQMPGTPSTVIEVENIFAPLQATLQRTVAALQSQDDVGCSWRAYGLGEVGVVEPSLNAQPLETLTELGTELSDSASTRINSVYDSAWPWRNLISSVGKPPVWTFCAFVLLFGLLLGPGLLLFTGWMGRRSLLIFLVPCVSLAATLLIAAYEILYEGFDTSIRVTSVLTIDQPTGKGFAWSRQTYFSGWPPGELKFPNEVYFRPVSAFQQYRYREIREPRRAISNRIEVGDDQRRWTGWLTAREQQQLLIGHPAKPAVPLQVTQTNPQRIKLKNLTDERLPFAAVRDGADSYFLAADLPAGAEVLCEAQTAYDVGVELTRIRARHMPVAPIELQGNSGWGWSRRYASFATEATSAEVLDAAWHEYLSEHLDLPPFGFVTLQQNSDAVYVPLKGNITESKHLVVGRLVW